MQTETINTICHGVCGTVLAVVVYLGNENTGRLLPGRGVDINIVGGTYHTSGSPPGLDQSVIYAVSAVSHSTGTQIGSN